MKTTTTKRFGSDLNSSCQLQGEISVGQLIYSLVLMPIDQKLVLTSTTKKKKKKKMGEAP
jgi:hypothetical protein